MNPSRTVEVLVGAFVMLGLAALVFLAMQVSGLTSLGADAAYRVHARFENVGGLKVRSPVSMAGVRIGRVTAIDIDPQTFQAVVELSISSRHANLPADTSAKILTSGLLGEQFVGLETGGADAVLKDGSTIKLTQSALVLENLISQFLFSKASEGRPETPAPAPVPAGQP